MNRTTRSLLVAATLVALVGGSYATRLDAQTPPAAQAAGTIKVRGTSSPKERLKLRFPVRGVILEALKDKGDTVKKGEIILHMNDAEQVATAKARRLDADQSLAVAAAEQEWEVAKQTLANTVKNHKDGAANDIELATDTAKAEIARIKVDQAKHQAEINAAQADAADAIVKQMTMTSPIDGIIVDVTTKAGEGVDESRDVVEVIDRSQLYIEVRLADIADVRKLSMGQTLRVQFKGDTQWREAKINLIYPEADAKAGTLPFRLVLDNPDQRPPGEDVMVEIPSSSGMAER
ncbi:MAG: efflux RND transporter periplasmic adaptor subunit [Tepidisphaeraceae bacterium]